MRVYAYVLAVVSGLGVLGILAEPTGDGSDLWGVVYAVATIVLAWRYVSLDKKINK